MNKFFGKRVLIVGSGISGKGAASALKQSGAIIYFFDGAIPDKIDFAVMSPGVKGELGALLEGQNIPVIGEIELGYMLDSAEITAITGTNGKTTTAMLTGDMLGKSGLSTIVCGNIGSSYSENALKPHDRTVVEVSSFQLLSVKEFHPAVAVITNISPDHLDRHVTMKNYINAKLDICKNQTESDYVIAPREVVGLLKERAVRSQIVMLGTDLCAENGYLTALGKRIIKVEQLAQKEEHNIENALMASAAALIMGANVDAISDALAKFRPADHRLRFVGKRDGKNFYNDSKATNIGAALAAARSMVGSTAIIAGGSDKGYEFDELFIELPDTIKYVIGMGEVKDKLSAAAKRQGYDNFISAGELSEAVKIAKTLDVSNVLLSPAAASFDFYDGYDKRGEHFERLIRE